MTIKGHIIDRSTGQGISRASVTVVDSNGTYLGQGVYADGSGNFGLVSPLIDANYILVSDVSYGPVMIDPSVFSTTGDPYEIPLDKSYDEEPGVVVTPKSKSSYYWLWVAGTGIVSVVAENSARKKKGGGVGAIDVTKLVLPVGALLIGVAVITPILQKLGLWDTAEDKAKKAAAGAAAKEQSAAGTAAAASNANRSFSDNDIKTMATVVASSTDSTVFDYKNLVKICAYFSGFTSADAKVFLGDYVDLNGITFYQWYVNRFQNTENLSGWTLWSNMQDYLANYQRMGIDTNSWLINPDDWALGLVKWVYLVAGLSMQ